MSIISVYLSADFLAGDEHLQHHTVATLGQLAALLGWHRADKPDDGGAVGKDPDELPP
ncbi:hypothetical protein AB0J28_03865 [Streptosporangium canum]|uniref:hypothetical protein n=1 Tax=Streptosporangium canum TaxID=324952 RepID=UPI00344948AB